MRFKQIVENSTTAGSVATVAQPMMTQTRESVDVKGLKPVKQLMKGTKKKGPYANSIVEGKVKELISDLKNLTSYDFEKKHKQSKADVRADMKKVTEDDLSEQDLIVIPGQGRLRGTGFTKHDPDRAEHEGQTLKNSLHTIIRLATHLDKELTVRDNFPEWVSEKVGSIKGDMLSVMNYIISSQEMRHDPDTINELSSALLQTAAQAATDKRNQAMDPELHNALGGGYMNPLAKHYDNVSQKMDNRAAQVKRKETIQNIASKIASPAVMRKMGMNEGSQRVDSIVTDALRVMKGPEVSDAVLALKRVLGDRAYNERRGFYSFYVDQIHDMYGQQGVAEGELEEDLSRRGFLRGLGAATLGATALGAASKAQASQDLGNGFVLTTVDVFGGKFKAVLDTQSDIHYLPNRHEGGGAIVRSMAPFIMIKNGQTNTAMNVGPAVQAALKKAGLLKGVEEGVKEGKIDFAKKLQKNVDNHNKAVVQTKKAVGSRISDIGAGGKEYNVKTDAAWDAAKKKVSEGLRK